MNESRLGVQARMIRDWVRALRSAWAVVTRFVPAFRP